jgi:hypothetical protein
VKCLDPVDRRKARLKKKRAQNIVKCAERAFGLSILLGSVWTRHAKCNTVGEKERAGRRIVKFTAIVALDTLDGGAELSVNIRKKIRKSGKCLRFFTEGKSPNVMGTIIQNDKMIFVPRDTNNRRCPKITVYQIKIIKSSRDRRPKRKPCVPTELTRMTYVVEIIFIAGDNTRANEFGHCFTPKMAKTPMPNRGRCCDEGGGAGGGWEERVEVARAIAPGDHVPGV